VRTTASDFPLTPLEVASGFIFGEDLQTPNLPKVETRAPVAVFEAAVRDALCRAPCGVAFSGGRDSSAVLASAVVVARREGLPLPIPITLRFPESAESDETSWQEEVIGHFGLEEWIRLEIRAELDCVGPVATAALQRHGLYWPANAHALIPQMELVPGGSLLTGNGGDIAFEPPPWATRPLAVIGREARPTPRDILRFGFALSPPRVRLAALRRRQWDPLPCPWLQPDALRAVEDLSRMEAARQPMRLDKRLSWAWRLRPIQMGLAAFDLFAADFDVKVVHPFHSPSFLASLARTARTFRLADRTEAMHMLFSDFLPHAVRARETKAAFTDVFWHRHSRAFAGGWEGEGADPALVKVDVLRDLWRSPEGREHFRSCTQLQASWLAGNVQNRSNGDRVEQPVGRLGE
jgi:asparagine synthase